MKLEPMELLRASIAEMSTANQTWLATLDIVVPVPRPAVTWIQFAQNNNTGSIVSTNIKSAIINNSRLRD